MINQKKINNLEEKLDQLKNMGFDEFKSNCNMSCPLESWKAHIMKTENSVFVTDFLSPNTYIPDAECIYSFPNLQDFDTFNLDDSIVYEEYHKKHSKLLEYDEINAKYSCIDDYLEEKDLKSEFDDFKLEMKKEAFLESYFDDFQHISL